MKNNAQRKARYIKGLSTYGIYPLLLILKEQEDVENYEECSLILEAIEDRVHSFNMANRSLDDFNLPRHLRELPDFHDEFAFTEEEQYKKNVQHYVKELKNLVG